MRVLKPRNNIMRAPTSGIGTRNLTHLSIFWVDSNVVMIDDHGCSSLTMSTVWSYSGGVLHGFYRSRKSKSERQIGTNRGQS